MLQPGVPRLGQPISGRRKLLVRLDQASLVQRFNALPANRSGRSVERVQLILRAAKQTLGQYYLQIDPPLYTAFVVATDLTGTSDTVQRLRNYLKNPVQEFSTRPVDSPTDVVFDRIELAYTPWGGDAIRPIVIYRLTGHSSDNGYTFTYYLKADAKP